MKVEYVWTVEENRERRAEVDAKRRRVAETKYENAPIDRFQEHRRSLVAAQSTLVSNLVHHFDNLTAQQTQELDALRKALPMKLRLKLSGYVDLLRVYFRTGQQFVEGIPQYRDLDLNHRCFLGNRSLTVLVGMHIMNNMNLTNFLPHRNGGFEQFHEVFYGEEAMRRGDQVRLNVKTVLDVDGTLMKLFLAILTFTHLTCDVTSNQLDDSSYSQVVGERQNQFIELIWSYMSYRWENERMVVNLFMKMIAACLQVQILIAEQNFREDTSSVALNELIEKTKSELLISSNDE